MAISQGSLAWLYACACLLGLALGAVYDLLRITRVFLGVRYSRRASRRLRAIRLPLLAPRTKRRESRALGVVVFFEDLFYCLFAGIAMILLFYECNNGKIRYPVFFLVAVGFLVYRYTLGRIVMLFSEAITFVLETAFRYFFFFIFYPFRFLYKQIKRAVAKCKDRAMRARKRRSRSRYTERELARTQKNACGLIPEDVPKARALKGGKKLVKQQKTVQPESARANPACHARAGIDRGVRK
ncbi:MAG: hypothetical protein E7637_07385 [Ruminococcaceae bacterium]|nr:hypothetical protein [Oscillospiraceae bacterium]